MATRNLIILSSSPPREFATGTMSSPALPSPGEIFKKKGTSVRTGSQASSIPVGASASFTTASTLLNASKQNATINIQSFALNSGDGMLRQGLKSRPPQSKTRKSTINEENAKLKPKAVRKPKVTTTKAIEDPVQLKKPRKQRVKKCDNSTDQATKKVIKPVVGDAAIKEKPIRKQRAQNEDLIDQTLLPEAKVTKRVKCKSKDEENETLQKSQVDGFGLVEAVKRKKEWTPPSLSAGTVSLTPASTLVLDNSMDDLGLSKATSISKGFSNLFGSFGYTNAAASTDSLVITAKTEKIVTIKKRKLIELVATAGIAEMPKSPPKKIPKKKATTITERATAVYADIEEPTDSAPLLNYFPLQNMDRSAVDFKIPAKPRTKSPVKKGSKLAPILLSPESAMKQVAKQDFVFGTSSQLAREDSPTFLRDLDEAMQASMQYSDPLEPLAGDVTPTISKRNLWAAASRGAQGELHDMDATQISEIANSNTLPSVPPTDSDWLDLDTLAERHQTTTVHKPVERSHLRDNSIDKPSTADMPKVAGDKNDMPQMPNFESYTTAKLAKEIASYRFKPIKSRDAMITLLERCWESKHQTALQSLDINSPKKKSLEQGGKDTLSIPDTPKRPRGRPRKDSSTTPSPPSKTRGRPKKALDLTNTTTSPIAKSKSVRAKKTTGIKTPTRNRKRKDSQEEILDSDSPTTPSPPRRRLSQIGQPPLPLQLSADDLEVSPELTSSQQKRQLFEHITKAVTSAPPAKDSKNPSWHEKILLYDPIVLEDLTVWLNTGALSKVGWDDEVAPSEVKKWCESKSICCLWRENLRGGSRSRY